MPVGSEPENRRADLRIFLADCSRLFARTRWRPKRGVTQIVTDIFEWVRAHEKALQPLV
jgi:nucleoside-diphosphate-sugar epimerase